MTEDLWLVVPDVSVIVSHKFT